MASTLPWAGGTALGRMARTVSETLEPKDVFAGAAEAAATVVPFDTMVVFRVEGPDAFELPEVPERAAR